MFTFTYFGVYIYIRYLLANFKLTEKILQVALGEGRVKGQTLIDENQEWYDFSTAP